MHKFLKNFKFFLLVLVSTVLTACGGGGDAATAQTPLAAISCVVPIAAKNTVTFDTTVMTAICGNVYVDPSVASNAHAAIATGYKNAINTNKAFYGALQLANPDVVACDYTRTNCANF